MSTELPPKIKRKRLPQTTSPNERFFSCNLTRLSIAAIRRKLLAKLALAAAARMLYRAVYSGEGGFYPKCQQS